MLPPRGFLSGVELAGYNNALSQNFSARKVTLWKASEEIEQPPKLKSGMKK